MKLSLATGTMTAALLYGATTRAQTYYVPPPIVTLPNSFVADNQVYDASTSGVRSFVETYRNRPEYAELDAKARELEAMKTRSWVIGLSTAAVGVALIAGGFLLYKEPTNPLQPADATPILVGACVGAPLIALSYFIGQAFAPSRADYLDFVNVHNRLNPQSPIKWQIGAAPGTRGPSVGGSATVFF